MSHCLVVSFPAYTIALNFSLEPTRYENDVKLDLLFVCTDFLPSWRREVLVLPSSSSTQGLSALPLHPLLQRIFMKNSYAFVALLCFWGMGGWCVGRGGGG